MPTLVATADFKDQIAIPADYWGANTTTLDNLIAKYEEDFLRRSLGNTLYALFMAAVADTSGRWKELKDGCDYVVGGITYHWAGVKPLIRAYVYYYYLKNNASYTTPTGEAQAKTENSNRISYINKQSQAWNEMSGSVRGLWFMLLNRVDDDSIRVYSDSEFVQAEVDANYFKPINGFGI